MKKWLKYLLGVLMAVVIFGAGMLCGGLSQKDDGSKEESEQNVLEEADDAYADYHRWSFGFISHINPVLNDENAICVLVYEVTPPEAEWTPAYDFIINEETLVTWKGKEIDKNMLKVGDFIRIVAHPDNQMMESYPGSFTEPPVEVEYLGDENYSGEPGPLDAWLKK